MKAPHAPAVPHEEPGGADSVEDFAKKHAISRSLAYEEIAAGRLTARKVGGRTIITSEDAREWRLGLRKVRAGTCGAESGQWPGSQPHDDEGEQIPKEAC